MHLLNATPRYGYGMLCSLRIILPPSPAMCIDMMTHPAPERLALLYGQLYIDVWLQKPLDCTFCSVEAVLSDLDLSYGKKYIID